MASAPTGKVLRLKKFAIDKIKPNRVILIIGKRGTGKSTLLKDILYHLRNQVDLGFAMTPTYDTQQMFEECLPKSHIYKEYTIECIRNILNCMESLKEQNKVRQVVIALDDCMYDKGIMKTKEMREIHMNGRHLNICLINSVQYLMDIGPDLRSQIDYVFVLKENIRSNREKLHKYFFGMFEKFDEFSLVMDKCTNNHELLVLDNTQHVNNNIEDCVFYYKANPNIGRFRIGKKIYFKLDHHFKKRNKDDHEQTQTKLPDPIVPKITIQQVEKLKK